MPLTPSADVRFHISDLFAKYAWALDTGDTDQFIDCFTHDGSFGDGGVEVRGHERIRKMVMQKYHGNPLFPGREHLVGQSRYVPANDAESDESWAVKSFAQVVLLRDVGAKLWWVGWYDDLVVRIGEEWLFRRRIANRFQGEILSGFPASSMAPLIMERPANYYDPI